MTERRYSLTVALPRYAAQVEAHFNQRLLPLEFVERGSHLTHSEEEFLCTFPQF